MPRHRQPLGEVLVQAGILTREQLANAVERQRQSQERLGQVLLGMGIVTQEDLSQAIARQLGLEHVRLEDIAPEDQAFQALPEHMARRLQVIPLQVSTNRLKLGMVDPFDALAIDDVRRHTGYDIEPAVITYDDFLGALNQYPTLDGSVEPMIKGIENELGVVGQQQVADDAPAVRLVHAMILQAIRRRASDIHIEPQEHRVRIRYRIDGVLYNALVLPKHIQAAVVSRAKVMAEMDIAEQRLPQDGRIALRIEDRDVDLRVSAIPTIFGEKVVMRILDKGATLMGIDNIGLLPESRQRFEVLIKKPYGIILLTGPTGIGKTTTQYAMLKRLNTTGSNIITIEDPVEYQLAGVNQVQVNPKAGLTFANGLRSFLRQDPDIIMVGEIRDEETARISIHAALTGHLVLSTLHTNDAAGAVTRLVDMGIEAFLVAASVIGVIAQRLIRILCDVCKQAYTPPRELLQRLGGSTLTSDGPVTFYRPVGCESCNNIGYRGRTGIFEIMLMDEAIKVLVTRRASVSDIKAAAVRAGMRTLAGDGLEKVRMGVTSAEEVLDTVYMDE